MIRDKKTAAKSKEEKKLLLVIRVRIVADPG
jgi:hypothetical protein